MKYPAQAIAWEIWASNRWRIVGVLIGLVGFGAYFRFNPQGSDEAELWLHLAYVVLVLALFVTYGMFHFTEGQSKGGFGSFPLRLFTLPIGTGALVLWPMLLGAVSVLLVYWGGVWLLLKPFGVVTPLLWPSLYLVAGLSMFQTIVWSLPRRRYGKLFCLAGAATLLAIGWMFFLPGMIEGTLEEWGYGGSTRSFQRGLLVGLAMMVPVSYLASVLAVGRQRSGGEKGRGVLGWVGGQWERCRPVRRRHFGSPQAALFWLEWRQSGLVLPVCVGIVLLLTFIPTYLTRPHTEAETFATIFWMMFSPLLFAFLVGRGFGKPDFWRQGLDIPVFHSVRPLTAAAWVKAKLQVALLSAALTWMLVLWTLFLWLCYAGNFSGLELIWMYFRGWQRSLFEQVMFCAFLIPMLVLLTWRLLVGGMASALGGARWRFYVSNGWRLVLFLSLLVFTLYLEGDKDRRLELHQVWRYVTWAPIVLGLCGLLKFGLGGMVWYRVCRQHLVSNRELIGLLSVWSGVTLVAIAFVYSAVTSVEWFKFTLLGGSLLLCPFVGPGLAILALTRNRSR